MPFLRLLLLSAALLCVPSANASAQEGFERDIEAPEQVELLVKNRDGRVTVNASAETQRKISLRATSPGAAVSESDVKIEREGGRILISVERAQSGGQGSGAAARNRIDLSVRVPERARVKVETEAGAVDVVGNVSFAEVETDTGTIRADVPLDVLRYTFHWTLSRPRFYSEVELPKVRQKRGGTYEISGRFPVKPAKKEKDQKDAEKGDGKAVEGGESSEYGETVETADAGDADAPAVLDKKAMREKQIKLELRTARGVILFGVADEASVPTDLRERELTESARAIIRSGDEDLTEAIRRIVPRLVGDYTKTLPPRETEPTLIARRDPFNVKTRVGETLARLQASVTDRNGRAIAGLSDKDFAVFEDGEERALRGVEPATAPFNLVLLLDVSGSVEERLDFIRKAALAFINTAGAQDRIAIISFRDDIQIISEFTTDRELLAKRIKAIQAGGGTALYDAIAYSLVHTLKPLHGERTGIVILSDGDDNKSFIPFPEVLEATVESGALIYPLYIPSGLIPADSAPAPATTLDPMRTRYLSLTSRAEGEGQKLAAVSGGVYYPITRLDQLQRAYDDVVAQLRTSYSITYESKRGAERDSRVRVRVAREGASVRLSPAVNVAAPPAATP
jgi:Ca-activated chloride channel family protein